MASDCAIASRVVSDLNNVADNSMSVASSLRGAAFRDEAIQYLPTTYQHSGLPRLT